MGQDREAVARLVTVATIFVVALTPFFSILRVDIGDSGGGGVAGGGIYGPQLRSADVSEHCFGDSCFGGITARASWFSQVVGTASREMSNSGHSIDGSLVLARIGMVLALFAVIAALAAAAYLAVGRRLARHEDSLSWTFFAAGGALLVGFLCLLIGILGIADQGRAMMTENTSSSRLHVSPGPGLSMFLIPIAVGGAAWAGLTWRKLAQQAAADPPAGSGFLSHQRPVTGGYPATMPPVPPQAREPWTEPAPPVATLTSAPHPTRIAAPRAAAPIARKAPARGPAPSAPKGKRTTAPAPQRTQPPRK